MAYEEGWGRVGGPHPKKNKKYEEREVEELDSIEWGRVGGPHPNS